MKTIDIFIQGERFREIDHIEIEEDADTAAIRKHIGKKFGHVADELIFLEDVAEALEYSAKPCKDGHRHGVKVHLHRCRHVEVHVSFAGRRIERSFPPSATLLRIKIWATQELGITPEDAKELRLQIAGTKDRPPETTHVGALVSCPDCRSSFDLLPDQLING